MHRVFQRYRKQSTMYKPDMTKFEIITDFPCMRQEPGNNLCAYYVMSNIHSVVTGSRRELVCHYMFMPRFLL